MHTDELFRHFRSHLVCITSLTCCFCSFWLLLLLLRFAGSAVLFAHSTVVRAWEAAFLPGRLTKSLPWWALKVFLTKQGLDFLAMAFLLLTWRECMAAWASVYYLPLLYMTGVLVLGNVFPVKAPKSGSKQGAGGAVEGSSKPGQEAAAGNTSGEPVEGDHLHLGEGIKSGLVSSRPSSRPDLVNGLKEQ